MTNGGEPLPGSSGEGLSSARIADHQNLQQPEEPLPTLPQLYRINYEGKPISEFPESRRLTEAIGHISTVQHYVKWRLDNSAKSLGELDNPLAIIGEYEAGFQQAKEVFEFALKPDHSDLLESASNTLLKQMKGATFTDEEGMDIAIPDYPTLLALNSSEMLEQLLHDTRSPLAVILGRVQLPRRSIQRQNDMSLPEEKRLKSASAVAVGYEEFRESLREFPNRVKSGIEKFLDPFTLESFKIESIESIFKGVAKEQFALVKEEVGDIPNITFTTDENFRKSNINFAPFLLGSIIENTVSNYVKKVRAMRNEHVLQLGNKPANFRTPFVMPRMVIGMGVEGGEFVLNIDDTGFPFSEDAIADGFEGMKERGEHGYLKDPQIETLGIGNAGISEILRTKFPKLQATWKPEEMTYTDDSGVSRPGARVQFRMKYASPDVELNPARN